MNEPNEPAPRTSATPETHTVEHRPSTLDATGAYQSTDPSTPPADGLPEIPGYTMIRELARGGMGCVYIAHEHALAREVAIKTLLPGANQQRFRTEAHLTARLSHPNIPPVYQLGTFGPAVPYLAMKYVRGQTLESLLRHAAEQLEPGQRISIVEQVAQAVGFAHQSGIIHRDLKPANIMVGAFEEVQVMDWGLARDVQAPEDEVGMVMGTPAYMAPEQARGERVTARTDVFALGGILKVILTGKPVFSGVSVPMAMTLAADGNVSQAFAELEACAADAELLALTKACLNADPEQRPADATEVAERLARYQHGVAERLRLAEQAHAASAAQIIEQRKRRRALQWAGSVVIAVLCVGIAGTSLGFWQARLATIAEAERAEKERLANLEAQEQKRIAQEEEAKERKARLEAERQTKMAERTRRFLIEYFTGRDSATGAMLKGGPGGANVTVREVIEYAETQVGKEFQDFPEAECDIRCALGLMLLMHGNQAKADAQLKRAKEISKALGREHTLDHRIVVATEASFKAFRFGDSTVLAGSNPLLALLQQTPGNDASDEEVRNIVTACLASHGAILKKDWPTAEKAARTMVELAEKKYTPQGGYALAARLTLASIFQGKGDYPAAKAELTTILERCANNPQGQYFETIARLAQINVDVSLTKNVVAQAPVIEALGLQVKSLGLESTEAGLSTHFWLGYLRFEQRRNTEAIPELLHTFRTMERFPIAQQRFGSLVISLLSNAYFLEKQYREAVPFYANTIHYPPPVFPLRNKLEALSLYGWALAESGDFQRGALELAPYKLLLLNMNDIVPVYALGLLGAGLGNQADCQAAITAMLKQHKPGVNTPRVSDSLQRLGRVAQTQGHHELAVAIHTQNYTLRKEQWGTNDWTVYESLHERALSLVAMQRLDQALADERAALEGYRRLRGDTHAETLAMVNNLVELYRRLNQFDDAIALRQEWYQATRRSVGINDDATWERAADLLVLCQQANNFKCIHADATNFLKAALHLTGDGDLFTLAKQHRLGVILMHRKHNELGAQLLAHVVPARVKLLGPEHADTLMSRAECGFAWQRSNKPQEALEQFQEAHAGFAKVRGADHVETRKMAARAGMARYALGQTTDAIAQIQPAYEQHLDKESVNSWMTQEPALVLMAALLDLKRTKEAYNVMVKVGPALVRNADLPRPELLALIERLRHATRDDLGANKGEYATMGVLHGDILSAMGRFKDAVVAYREALAIGEVVNPKHPFLHNHRAKLGRAFAQSDQFEEAEKVLLAAHAAAKAQTDGTTLKPHEVSSSLVDLYVRWKKLPEAAKWGLIVVADTPPPEIPPAPKPKTPPKTKTK